jgi:hypothetical protein
MRQEELKVCAETLRAFLPRMSMQTAEAWSEMVALERLPLRTVVELDTHTGDVVERMTHSPTIAEVRAAAMRVARTMGPQDWPSPRALLEAVRAVRRELLAEERSTKPMPALPAKASLSDEDHARNKARARETVAYLREKLGIIQEASEVDVQGSDVRLHTPTEEDVRKAEARRAELRRQAAMLMGARNDE